MVITKDIIKALPLIASILGDRYGIKIEIGGTDAYTNGKTIHLPSLPLDSSDILVNLIRGYIDHEAAHIRFTDFKLPKDLSELEKCIWNILEDWRVENALAKLYAGSASNFAWLIEHLFSNYQSNIATSTTILDYILLTVRAWDCSKITKSVELCRKLISSNLTILQQIDKILLELKAKCQTCADSAYYAKKIAKILKIELDKSQNPELEELFNLTSSELTKSTGELVQDLLACQKSYSPDLIQVAKIGHKDVYPLSPQSVSNAKLSTIKLKTKLQSLLQAKVLEPSCNARRGKLDTKKLYKLAIHNPKIFIQKGERQKINTAVHIILDCSASMSSRIKLASEACYALALSLQSITGINVAVTAFPAMNFENNEAKSVFPLVKHGEKVSNKFSLKADNTTPLADTLWFVLQQMLKLKENRKIILILSDGDADSIPACHLAISYAQKLNFEVYGLGIMSTAINLLLPNTSTNIQNIEDLAPAMFAILQNAFSNPNQRR